MEKKEVKKYSRWFMLGMWATVINIVLTLALTGMGIVVYGVSFLLLGRTRLAIGISVIISVGFFVFGMIAQGWGEDWTQTKVRKAKTDQGKIMSILIVVVLVVVVLGGIGARMRATPGEGFLGFQIPDIILNLVVPDSGDSGAQDFPEWPDYPDYEPPPPAENSLAPTALTVFISPNPVDMGSWIEGSVTSNGYNWPLRIVLTHRGSGESGEIAGFLGADGQFIHWSEFNIPGVWDVTAYADGVSSATATFVCRGILVIPERSHYSKTMSDSMPIGVYSHHTNQNAGIVGHYPAGSYSRAITNTMINAGGYGEVAPNLDSLANGDWELDAIIGSDSATAWTGTYWITVGR